MEKLIHQHLTLDKDKMPSRRQYYEKDWMLYLQCKWCWEYKSPDNFYKHKICFMGLSSICKDCNHKHWVKYHAEHREEDNRKNRERHLANRDQINEKNRGKYRTDSDFRKLCSDRARKWREENKEANLKHHHEYYLANKEMILTKSKEYYNSHREQHKDTNKRYRETHREQLNRAASEWGKTHREVMNNMQRKYREKNKRKMEIYRDVERKVNQLWWYPKDCPICWKETMVVWHHPDYNKPLEIVFCCNMCHNKIHSGIIECPKPIDLLKI